MIYSGEDLRKYILETSNINKIIKLNAEKEESEKNLDNILWEIKNEHEKLKNAFVGNIRSKRIFAEFILGKYNKEKSYTPNEDTLENLNKQSAFYTVEHNTIEIEINKNALKKSIIAHVLNTSKIF